MIKIIIFVFCFFIILVHFKHIEKVKENFENNIRMNLEHFEGAAETDIPSIGDLMDETKDVISQLTQSKCKAESSKKEAIDNAVKTAIDESKGKSDAEKAAAVAKAKAEVEASFAPKMSELSDLRGRVTNLEELLAEANRLKKLAEDREAAAKKAEDDATKAAQDAIDANNLDNELEKEKKKKEAADNLAEATKKMNEEREKARKLREEAEALRKQITELSDRDASEIEAALAGMSYTPSGPSSSSGTSGTSGIVIPDKYSSADTSFNKGGECTKVKDGECLFGCPDTEVTEYTEPEVSKSPSETCPQIPQKVADIDDMILTIEETEKICDLIEDKDKTRKDKEEYDALKKQIDLNKKFLIQQKAQDKQISDLNNLIKSMSFTHEMNVAAIEKCGKNSDDCLSDKEKKLLELLKEKQDSRKEVKVNVNIKDFGAEFMKHLMEKMGLSGDEFKKLLDAVNNGLLSVDDLKKQSNFTKELNNNKNDKKTGLTRDIRKNTVSDKCPTCTIDLSKYIDRCKIPCHRCRDPSWKCPQDVGR